MAERLASLQGKALLSINDHPEMRRIFGRFPVVVSSLRYSIGKPGKAREKASGELVYRVNC